MPVSNICQGEASPQAFMRMAAGRDCSSWSSSNLTLLPTPQLTEPSRIELYNLPCNNLLLSGNS